MNPDTPTVLHATIPLDLRLVEWKHVHLSSNQRLHHHELNRRTQLWQDLAAKAAQRVKPLEWARIEVWYRFPDNRRREVSNLQPTSKAIIDGMVQQESRRGARRRPFVQLLPDDSDRYLVGPDNRRDPVNGSHQVVVRVYRAA